MRIRIASVTAALESFLLEGTSWLTSKQHLHGHSDSEDQERMMEWSYLATQRGPEPFLGSGRQMQRDSQSYSQALAEPCKAQTVDRCAKCALTFWLSLSPISQSCRLLSAAALQSTLVSFGGVRTVESFNKKKIQDSWGELSISWLYWIILLSDTGSGGKIRDIPSLILTNPDFPAFPVSPGHPSPANAPTLHSATLKAGSGRRWRPQAVSARGGASQRLGGCLHGGTHSQGLQGLLWPEGKSCCFRKNHNSLFSACFSGELAASVPFHSPC